MYVRKLPSGRWQATVRHPSGKRITKTDPLKKVVNDWGRDLEAQFARGDVRDPRAGRITVEEWRARWIAARGIEPGTRRKLESIWSTHCETWATWPMDAVTVLEAQAWVRALEGKQRARSVGEWAETRTIAATTVREAVHHMSSLYVAAMRERPPLVLGNPFHQLDLPRVPPAPADFLTRDEVRALLEALRRLRPDEPQWPLLVEMGTHMGLRPGELFGLAGDRVDWLRGTVNVTRVMTRSGLREYPKSRRSHRTVPISRPGMSHEMSALLSGRGREALIFTRPQGGPVDDTFFRHRIWDPAVRAADIRPLPPKTMRRTAASWLVQDGVPLLDVAVLLGHESPNTTARHYAHLVPDAHARVVESWRRTSDARRDPETKAGHGA